MLWLRKLLSPVTRAVDSTGAILLITEPIEPAFDNEEKKNLRTYCEIYCARHSWEAETVQCMLWLRKLLSPVTRAVDSTGAITESTEPANGSGN